MDSILSVAMQCDCWLKLLALMVVCHTLLIGVLIVSLVAVKALGTLAAYFKVAVKVSSNSANVELDLNK